VLAVVLVVCYLGFAKDVPFVNEPYEIRAAFADSHGIRDGSPVRIAGVEVGEVTDVQGTSERSRSAVVTMAVREGGRPVHRDARARIRPRIFLEGNFFVELSPGSPGSPELGEGDAIPVAQTSSAVQLDQVLKALRSDVRRDLRRVFAELARTEAAGGARAFNRSLGDQAEAYRTTAIVAEALLGEREGDLARFIRSQGLVSAALTEDRQALRDLVTGLNRTFGAFAAGEADLRAAVNELPRTLRTALPTLAALNRAFPDVRRFAREGLPGVRSTGPAARAATPFVAELRGLFGAGELRGLSRDLRDTVPSLAGLAQETVPLLRELRLGMSCLDEVLVPTGSSRVDDPAFPATGALFQEFPKQLVGLAGESRSFDANGQWFKVLATGGAQAVTLGNGLFGTTATPLRGINPPPVGTTPPLRPDVPCETQAVPDLRSTAAPPPAAVPTDADPEAVQQRVTASRRVAIEAFNARLAAEGSAARVLDQDITAEQVAQLAEGLGLTGQLQTLTRTAPGGGG
jgi:virulence factor Mce-like protein